MKPREKQESLAFPTGGRGEGSTLERVLALKRMHELGLLGGEVMPEDANPGLPLGSSENYLYFTLPMALNYQRNSYSLWRSAQAAFQDNDTRWVFSPREVVGRPKEELRRSLLKYKVALQPEKHTATWHKICETLASTFEGDVRRLFAAKNWDIPQIVEAVRKDLKPGLPYLAGPKICNYWLFVLGAYTDAKFKGREHLTVAPDTHVIQASVVLGLLSEDEAAGPRAQALVADGWRATLAGTPIVPIDIHTPLWLWSRLRFPPIQAKATTPLPEPASELASPPSPRSK